MKEVRRTHVPGSYTMACTGFEDLYRWSVEHPDLFWETVWRFCGICATRKPDRTVDDPRKMPRARWFPGAMLNFAENLLRYRVRRRSYPGTKTAGRADSPIASFTLMSEHCGLPVRPISDCRGRSIVSAKSNEKSSFAPTAISTNPSDSIRWNVTNRLFSG